MPELRQQLPTDRTMVLSVIMPAYNEVASIWSVVEEDLQLLAALPRRSAFKKLAVSDDGRPGCDGGRSD